jgi:uncharacterized membrane protein YhaH (DUF805 family)
MNFSTAVASVFRNYATFHGRALRSEYWWYLLFWLLATVAIIFVENSLGMGEWSLITDGDSITHQYNLGILSAAWLLSTFLPSLAVQVRRLQDTDRPGWLVLLVLIPLIGAVVLIVLYSMKGTAGPNSYGEDPLAAQPPVRSTV